MGNEPRIENGSNGAHVQGVRDMVLNTQKANIHKVNTILESNLMKVQTSKVIRGQKEQTLREAIRAAEEFKNKLQEEFNNNQVVMMSKEHVSSACVCYLEKIL